MAQVLGPSTAQNRDNRAVEDVYQKKTQLEHILLRPDTYIGSIEHQQQTLWVHDGEAMVSKPVSFVPGLYKIFDEILVNAADNKVRDPTMDTLRVDVDEVRALHFGLSCPHTLTHATVCCNQDSLRAVFCDMGVDWLTLMPCADVVSLCSGRRSACAGPTSRMLQTTGAITVWNNGSGVPVEMHKKEGVYVPELIFGHLLTSSNYEDDQKKVRSDPFKFLELCHNQFREYIRNLHTGNRWPQRLRCQAGQHLLHRIHHRDL